MNSDKNNPFKDIAKIFHELQRQFLREMQNAQDPESDRKGDTRSFGFSIHMGPDGNPHITPMKSGQNTYEMDNQVHEPFTDAFYNENNQTYQIIVELPGISIEQVNIDIEDNDFTLTATDGDRKFKKSMLLKYPLIAEKMASEIRNGVLEIIAPIRKD